MDKPDIIVPLSSLLLALNILGIAVFAATGALVAANLRQTLVTFCFFAVVTGVGGGTVRDILIGAPVFWIHDPVPSMVCLTVAFLVWLTPVHWWRPRTLDWLDGIGLAAFAVYGTAKALNWGVDPFVAILMGIVTTCMGGVIRDILAGRPSIILRPEIYVTAGALAAVLYTVLTMWVGLPNEWSAFIGSTAGFALRAMAISRGLALPAYSYRDEEAS